MPRMTDRIIPPLALVSMLFLVQVPVPEVPRQPSPEESPVRLLGYDGASKMELWDTRLGRFWIPAPGKWVVSNLEWEQVDRKIYDHPSCGVNPGDIVIDCGAHVGFFTRVALEAGAHVVVAVEPEERALAAFRRNFEVERQSGRVRIVPMGVWDSVGRHVLRLSNTSNDSHSLVLADNHPKTVSIEVTTIDAIEQSLDLPRIDFIKMDIEGAERNALRGARHAITHWRPRLAISTYHLPGDPGAISSIIWAMRPDYRIGSKDIVQSPHGAVVPKVLFFY